MADKKRDPKKGDKKYDPNMLALAAIIGIIILYFVRGYFPSFF